MLNVVYNVFKVNNKNTRMTLINVALMYFLLTLIKFCKINIVLMSEVHSEII